LLCPACNALASHQPLCPRCGADAVDDGRATDWAGPYAPYGPEAFAAPAESGDGPWCLHAARCPSCGETFEARVPLWPL